MVHNIDALLTQRRPEGSIIVSVITQDSKEAPSRIEQIEQVLLFMKRFRAAGFSDLIFGRFVNTPVHMDELVAAARNILKYRYATVRLANYEPYRVFGIRIGYGDPYNAARGYMLIDVMSNGSRGMPRHVSTDWSPLAKGVEAKIISQETGEKWGRGAHTTVIRVRTSRPVPS